jgi:hypothetical protein
MAENLYYMGNHVLPTTGLPTKVTTSTAATVMLQLSVPTTHPFTLCEYGISFDGSPSAIQVQLRATSAGVVATNNTAGSITAFNNSGAPTSASTSGTSNSCFFNGTSTNAPTSTVAFTYDTQILTTNTYIKQWPLGREPQVASSDFVQLCVLAGTAVNASCYIIWRE